MAVSDRLFFKSFCNESAQGRTSSCKKETRGKYQVYFSKVAIGFNTFVTERMCRLQS